MSTPRRPRTHKEDFELIYVKKGALIKLVEESAAAKYTAEGFTVLGTENTEEKQAKSKEKPEMPKNLKKSGKPKKSNTPEKSENPEIQEIQEPEEAHSVEKDGE